MSSIEYVQNMPEIHRFHQQEVNKQLWLQWNLADHQRAIADFTTPHRFEKTIVSADIAAERPQDPYASDVPPPLHMHYSISSRTWKALQESYVDAVIGEIFFAKDGTGFWDPNTNISYVLQRVDTPYRWEKYCIHHKSHESFADIIHQHTQ